MAEMPGCLLLFFPGRLAMLHLQHGRSNRARLFGGESAVPCCALRTSWHVASFFGVFNRFWRGNHPIWHIEHFLGDVSGCAKIATWCFSVATACRTSFRGVGAPKNRATCQKVRFPCQSSPESPKNNATCHAGSRNFAMSRSPIPLDSCKRFRFTRTECITPCVQ